MDNRYWPFFDLVIRTPRLQLRLPTDDVMPALADAADSTIFGDGPALFLSDWLSTPSPRRQRESMQYWWAQRASLRPDEWSLPFAVFLAGAPVGVQEVSATKFPLKRTVSTGSWLTTTAQGQGVGKEMRRAVLGFVFDGLGAEEAHSGAFEANARSIGVSLSVGYEENGRERTLRGSVPDVHVNFRMTRARWDDVRPTGIEVKNLEPCLPLFGLGPDLAPLPSE
jgi:RimJ/RimL family protein N-acetyltransferase